MDKKKKRVAIYTRVSTLEQVKEGYGLKAQLKNLKDKIIGKTEDGWVFDENLIYSDEGVSGADENRPALDRMKKDIQLGLIDVVLVWKIDRLFRKTQYLLEIVEFFIKYKVKFASKSEDIDTSTPMGIMVLTVLGAIAEMERELIAERTMEGKLAKARDGFYVSGEPPYGYSKTEDKKLIINKEEAEIVKRIFNMYVVEKKSQGQIADILTIEKIPLKADSMANKKKKPKHTKGIWKQTFISNIIGKPHYIGNYYYNQREYIKDKDTKKITSKAKPKAERISIDCPAIFEDISIYNRAQALSVDNLKNAKKKENYRYLLAGLLLCGEDGCERSYGGYKTSKTTRSYRCKGKSGKDGRIKDGKKCDNTEISLAQIEGLVWDSILKLVNKPKDFKEHFVDKSSTDKKVIEYMKELEIFNDRKLENENNVKNIIKSMSGKSNIKKYLDEELDKLNKEEGIIDNRIDELEQLIISERETYSLDSTLKDISKELKGKIKDIEKDRDAMFDLIKMLVYKVVVYKKRIDIFYIFDKVKPSDTYTRQKKNIEHDTSYSLLECEYLIIK